MHIWESMLTWPASSPLKLLWIGASSVVTVWYFQYMLKGTWSLSFGFPSEWSAYCSRKTTGVVLFVLNAGEPCSDLMLQCKSDFIRQSARVEVY